LWLTALSWGFWEWFLSVLDGARRVGQNHRHSEHDASGISGGNHLACEVDCGPRSNRHFQAGQVSAPSLDANARQNRNWHRHDHHKFMRATPIRMNNILKLVLLPYFGLGMFMAVACSSHSAWHPGLNGFLILGAVHVVLIGSAYFLAINSKRNGTRLSPVGLAIGLGLAYFAGFLIFLFV
jgi:hypothetical protein